MKVTIVGRGKVGRGIARALRSGGASVRLVAGRSDRTPRLRQADLVILAVPDQAIAPYAARMAEGRPVRAPVVHCAGARGLDVLDALRARGTPVGAMHPMLSFADPQHPPSLRGATLVVQGDAPAVRAVRELARTTGAHVAVAPVHGPAYHAAAVLVANASAALADTAVGLLERLGMERRPALRAVAGLLRTVADNVEHLGVPRALTGPVARGDADTVRAHRRALATLDARAADAYDRIGPVLIATAARAGLPPARQRALRRAFS